MRADLYLNLLAVRHVGRPRRSRSRRRGRAVCRFRSQYVARVHACKGDLVCRTAVDLACTTDAIVYGLFAVVAVTSGAINNRIGLKYALAIGALGVRRLPVSLSRSARSATNTDSLYYVFSTRFTAEVSMPTTFRPQLPPCSSVQSSVVSRPAFSGRVRLLSSSASESLRTP